MHLLLTSVSKWTYVELIMILPNYCWHRNATLQLKFSQVARYSSVMHLQLCLRWLICGWAVGMFYHFLLLKGKNHIGGKYLGLTPGIFHAINSRVEHVKVQSFDLVTEHHFPGSSSNELPKCSDCNEPMMRCWRQLENHEAMSQSLECIKTKVCPSPH